MDAVSDTKVKRSLGAVLSAATKVIKQKSAGIMKGKRFLVATIVFSEETVIWHSTWSEEALFIEALRRMVKKWDDGAKLH